jgi:A/G-specific adenine glycosylase
MTSRKRAAVDSLSRSDKLRITGLRSRLIEWYGEHGRGFPWRAVGASNFEKICVEVLLQRTRADAVAEIYPVFFGRFRSWADIATCSLRELEEYFKPIGLWQRRSRSIKGLAEYAAPRSGVFPSALEELAVVPGVGQYVANAILLFQHGQARPLLDTNMARVLERYIRPRRLSDIRYDPWLQAAAHWLVRGKDPVLANWATLDFAGSLCLPRPRCERCCLVTLCNYARGPTRLSPSFNSSLSSALESPSAS